MVDPEILVIERDMVVNRGTFSYHEDCSHLCLGDHRLVGYGTLMLGQIETFLETGHFV
jgi:hypothetical protein